MKQLSLLDLPEDPAQGYDGPRLWWTIKYKPLYEQAVATFMQMYAVRPIFHFEQGQTQIFLTSPDNVLLIDRASGLLVESVGRNLWSLDYREVEAFRPKDVAPQIRTAISDLTNRQDWKPMIMVELKAPVMRVEAFADMLAEQGVFAYHWPARQESHMFRLFGAPCVLDNLIYSQGICLK